MKIMRGDIPSGYKGLLIALLSVMVKAQKHYCWITQDHLVANMGKYEDIVIWRSTLNVWLNWLENEYWIKRYGGVPVNIGGKLVNRATRYYLLPKALNYLKKFKDCVQKVARVIGVRFFGQDKATPKRYVGLKLSNGEALEGLALIYGRASPV